MVSVLNDTEKAVIETIRMRFTTQQALQYLKDNGFPIARATYFRHKRKVEEKKLQRLYHIAKLGFEDQHLERIDNMELIQKLMWQNYFNEQNAFRKVLILEKLAAVQPYLSSYYEATKYVIDNKTNIAGLLTDSNQENLSEKKRIMETEEHYRKQKDNAVF